MARRGKFSAQKRLREAKKRQKKQDKDERRAQLLDGEPEEAEEFARPPVPQPDGDPDLAGITPGPQPTLREFRDPE